MTVLSSFDIANDLKIQMYMPGSTNNVFVLGISRLDGANVLGDDDSGTFSWRNLEVDVIKVETEIGGSIASNINFQANAGRATIEMQSTTFDPANNPFIRPGVLMRVMLKRGIYERIIWYGFLDEAGTTYAPDEPNRISFSGVDLWSGLVNTRFNYDPTGVGGIDKIYPSTAIATAMSQLIAQGGSGLSYTDSVSSSAQWYMTQTPATNTTFGNFMQDILVSGLGFTWVDPNTQELKYRARSVSGTPTYTVGNNHGDPGHLCMSDISISMASDDIYNNLLVKQKYEYLTNPLFEQIFQDSDSIDLFGERARDFTIDLAEIADASAWATAVSVAKSLTHVQKVVTPTLDLNNNLTEAALFMPGDIIGVDYQTSDVDIQDTYTITRVGQTIDVKNWFTTLELWKEF